MISERLREGRTAGTDLRWHVTDIHREAADVIDALVAALVDACEHYHPPWVQQKIDAALALARRK